MTNFRSGSSWTGADQMQIYNTGNLDRRRKKSEGQRKNHSGAIVKAGTAAGVGLWLLSKGKRKLPAITAPGASADVKAAANVVQGHTPVPHEAVISRAESHVGMEHNPNMIEAKKIIFPDRTKIKPGSASTQSALEHMSGAFSWFKKKTSALEKTVAEKAALAKASTIAPFTMATKAYEEPVRSELSHIMDNLELESNADRASFPAPLNDEIRQMHKDIQSEISFLHPSGPAELDQMLEKIFPTASEEDRIKTIRQLGANAAGAAFFLPGEEASRYVFADKRMLDEHPAISRAVMDHEIGHHVSDKIFRGHKGLDLMQKENHEQLMSTEVGAWHAAMLANPSITDKFAETFMDTYRNSMGFDPLGEFDMKAIEYMNNSNTYAAEYQFYKQKRSTLDQLFNRL